MEVNSVPASDAKPQGAEPPPPRISIIMLTFNRPQFIGRAIESAISQSLQDWEMLVVQDGNNQEIVRIMQDWQTRESRIKYFHRAQGGNIANACNYAIARASGEYLAILDDDDYWATPDKLAKQVEFLERNLDYVGCGGGVTVIDEHGHATLNYMKQQHDEQIKRNCLFANPMAHSTTMFRKSAALQVGGYEESLAGFQDWDLFLKLGKIGKLYNFHEVFLYYTIWGGGGSFSAQKANTRSALKIVRRHWGKYRGSYAAFGLAFTYFCYAHLPISIKQRTFSRLSRLKKRIFSEKHAT